MRSVERVHLKEMPDRPHRVGSYRNYGVRASRPTAHAARQAGTAEHWIAQESIVLYEMLFAKVGGREPYSAISRLEFRTLVAQCSILGAIAGIVSWLIAA